MTTPSTPNTENSQAPPNKELIPIKRALLSVFNKTDLIAFGKILTVNGIECFSSAGTYQLLHEAGIPIKSVESLTTTGEFLGGRVKTLHPTIHGGILMKRNDPTHVQEAMQLGIKPFDLIVINLYPFEKISGVHASGEEAALETALEMIDIGGPALLRAGAKNFPYVTVVSSPHDYSRVADAIEQKGGTTRALRAELALKAFQQTAHYDHVISQRLASKFSHHSFTYLERQNAQKQTASSTTTNQPLRYGENPHQQAWLALTPPEERETFSIGNTQLLSGTPLSYNNILDAEAAIHVVRDIHKTLHHQFPATSVIIKHGTPCGLAIATTLPTAMEAALAGDIVSRYGSVIAVTQPLDRETALALKQIFVEIILAPDYTDAGLEILAKKNKRMRILKLPEMLTERKFHKRPKYHYLESATLSQTHDTELFETLRLVTEHPNSPTVPDESLFHFANIAVKHTKSNAITLVAPYQDMQTGYMLLGLGAGQPNRLDSIKKLAIPKMEENLARLYPEATKRHQILTQTVLASDAFFPFSDSLEPIAESGVQHIIQPGGSIRDNEIIAEANKRGLTMMFTNRRHFLH